MPLTRSHHAQEHPLRTGRPLGSESADGPEPTPRDYTFSVEGSVYVMANEHEKWRAVHTLKAACRVLGLAVVDADAGSGGSTGVPRRRWTRVRISREAAAKFIADNPGGTFDEFARHYLLGMNENNATLRYARQRAVAVMDRLVKTGRARKRFDPVTGELRLFPPDPHEAWKHPELYQLSKEQLEYDPKDPDWPDASIKFPSADEPWDPHDAWKYPDIYAMGYSKEKERKMLRQLRAMQWWNEHRDDPKDE